MPGSDSLRELIWTTDVPFELEVYKSLVCHIMSQKMEYGG